MSPGQQQITRYFESWLWNAEHPEATQHPPVVLLGDNAEHVQIWGQAESKRLGVFIAELTEEAERRGILGNL